MRGDIVSTIMEIERIQNERITLLCGLILLVFAIFLINRYLTNRMIINLDRRVGKLEEDLKRREKRE